MVFVLHVLKLCPWSRGPYKFPCTSRVRRYLHVVLFPRMWVLSFFLFPHMRTFDFCALGGPYKFPCTSLTTLSFVSILQVDRISQILRRIFPRELSGLIFAGIIGCGFATGEPSLEVASWPLFDTALCFPIGSGRKLLKWLQENVEKFIMLNKRRRWFHSSRVKLTFVKMSTSCFFGVHTFDSDLRFQVDPVRTTHQAQLCGFCTRVSLLDFVLW